MIISVFGHYGLHSFGWLASYKKTIGNVESFDLMVDTLQGNVGDALKDHFLVKAHGKNTRSD